MAMLPCYHPCLLLTLLTGRPEYTTTTTTSFVLSLSVASSMILIDAEMEGTEEHGEERMKRRETGDGRWETGDGRRETGDGRRETGDGRTWDTMGDGRQRKNGIINTLNDTVTYLMQPEARKPKEGAALLGFL
ncbi:hypothetical protein C8R48DRAFT_668095 [Suillus tomentosus]|nr:hypothetical protein C8R48DRAFT_668095 [Suillus tomentosus]